MISPECPICGEELEVDDVYDREVDDEKCVEYVIGHCPSCDKEFQWENIGEISKWKCEKLRKV